MWELWRLCETCAESILTSREGKWLSECPIKRSSVSYSQHGTARKDMQLFAVKGRVCLVILLVLKNVFWTVAAKMFLEKHLKENKLLNSVVLFTVMKTVLKKAYGFPI
jgi:hypothetical protein